MASRGLPLIRLAFFTPFVEELGQRGLDASSLFQQVGLEASFLQTPNLFVPANVIYRLAELAADLAQDAFLGATMGARFDIRSSPLFSPPGHCFTSLGDCLFCFVRESQEHASSQRYGLLVKGHRAVLFGERTFKPSDRVGQVDAWDVAVWTTLIREMVGDRWDPLKISVRVSEPALIPASLLPAVSLVRGGISGCSYTFPAEWLDLLPNSASGPETPSLRDELISSDTVETSVRGVLRNADLSSGASIGQFARLVGIHPRQLQRSLADEGTTYAKLFDAERRARALEALLENDRPVSSVAASLGYSDAANFTRAFRRWTGQSPSQYRRSGAASKRMSNA
ncbi:helix-turn-helix domain-containing protein [Roseibium sp.]|uniref:helix-turn-helix domain-containing protein n=1 Tax=Roseibium sp. TaxID=1936156 RepID=UPI003A97AFA1